MRASPRRWNLTVCVDATLIAARYIGPTFLRTLSNTWRFRLLDTDGRRVDVRPRAARGIYALWHSQQLALTLAHRNQNIAVIVSRHRDGEIISRMVAGIGYRTIRGSSTRGGSAALREFIRAAAEGHSLAITTDGPQGPARRCKPGAVLASARTGLPIVPVAAAASRVWQVSSWDEFFVPKPGSVVYLNYGEPIPVPADIEREALADWQDRVTSAQNAASTVCENAVARTLGKNSP